MDGLQGVMAALADDVDLSACARYQTAIDKQKANLQAAQIRLNFLNAQATLTRAQTIEHRQLQAHANSAQKLIGQYQKLYDSCKARLTAKAEAAKRAALAAAQHKADLAAKRQAALNKAAAAHAALLEKQKQARIAAEILRAQRQCGKRSAFVVTSRDPLTYTCTPVAPGTPAPPPVIPPPGTAPTPGTPSYLSPPAPMPAPGTDYRPYNLSPNVALPSGCVWGITPTQAQNYNNSTQAKAGPETISPLIYCPPYQAQPPGTTPAANAPPVAQPLPPGYVSFFTQNFNAALGTNCFWAVSPSQAQAYNAANPSAAPVWPLMYCPAGTVPPAGTSTGQTGTNVYNYPAFGFTPAGSAGAGVPSGGPVQFSEQQYQGYGEEEQRRAAGGGASAGGDENLSPGVVPGTQDTGPIIEGEDGGGGPRMPTPAGAQPGQAQFNECDPNFNAKLPLSYEDSYGPMKVLAVYAKQC